MGFIAYIVFAAMILWIEHRVTEGIINRALGPIQPNIKCRACGKVIDGVAEELGLGAFVCQGCYPEIALEAGIVRPDWFEEPCPPEDSEAPKQLEAADITDAEIAYIMGRPSALPPRFERAHRRSVPAPEMAPATRFLCNGCGHRSHECAC